MKISSIFAAFLENMNFKAVSVLVTIFSLFQALNTFIDDIFAFVIKMPTMYRLGCFRDDIVFFIFLYQRYIYRVSCVWYLVQ